jgi:hypothetical protein
MSKKPKPSRLAIFFYSIFFSIIFFLSFVNLYFFYKKAKPKLVVVENPEVEFWQKFVEKNPNYRDGFLRLYEIETTKGNVLGAESAIKRANELSF